MLRTESEMRWARRLAAACGMLLWGLGLPVLAQDQHATHADAGAPTAHAHAHGQPVEAAPPQGRRWATDAPLRAGMRQLRDAVQALHPEGGVTPDQALKIAEADRIDAALQSMFANCKLQPQADAALHGLLAKFIAGAQALRHGDESTEAIDAMHTALLRYPDLFDDADW